MLAPRRAENGEFFYVSLSELDAALELAQSFVSESKPLIQEAQSLRKRKPGNQMPEPSSGVLELCRNLKVARAKAYLLEQDILMLESRLQIAIGENAGFSGIASWKWQEQTTFDSKRFEREQPELFQEYSRPWAGRVFRLK
jgi:hypothetical protein